MILLVNPRVTKPRNRRFPLSVMSVGAALPVGVSWEILDGNLPDVDVFRAVNDRVERGRAGGDPVTAIALTVMPGPQLVSAIHLTRGLRQAFPEVAIVWGGYFPTLYPEPVLRKTSTTSSAARGSRPSSSFSRSSKGSGSPRPLPDSAGRRTARRG